MSRLSKSGVRCCDSKSYIMGQLGAVGQLCLRRYFYEKKLIVKSSMIKASITSTLANGSSRKNKLQSLQRCTSAKFICEFYTIFNNNCIQFDGYFRRRKITPSWHKAKVGWIRQYIQRAWDKKIRCNQLRATARAWSIADEDWRKLDIFSQVWGVPSR